MKIYLTEEVKTVVAPSKVTIVMTETEANALLDELLTMALGLRKNKSATLRLLNLLNEEIG